MCSKRFLFALCFCASLLVPAFSQEDAKQEIMSEQELILSICQSLIEYFNTNDNILQQERESLQNEKEGFRLEKENFAQEKADFENYKELAIQAAPSFLELKRRVTKQSEQLANLNNIISIGAPIAIAIIFFESILLAIK